MPRAFRRVCVFCGSNAGNDPAYAAAAESMGRLLARAGVALVYGGGNVGLMGRIADAVLAENGEVIGVIPRHLEEKEVAHRGVTELRVVDSMHVRKATMADLSDAFVAMPGGLGTLDELFEVATWRQLDLHQKPIGVLNTHGFFDRLTAYLDHAVGEGFIALRHRDALIVRPTPEALLAALQQVSPTRGVMPGSSAPGR
jgi:uncharacterized protein (TIGR00730 family)